MKPNEKLGVIRGVWVPKTLDVKIEETRKKLGWNRSRFYTYAVTRLLEELNVLTSTIHEQRGQFTEEAKK
jgi:hypothetical protein